MAYLTDSNNYIPANYTPSAAPPWKGIFTDPAFGTKILRLTDALGDGRGWQRYTHEYTENAAVDRTNTYIVIKSNGGVWHLFTTTGDYVRQLPSGDEWRWSRNYDDVAYYRTGNSIRRYVPSTGNHTLLHDFGAFVNFAGGQCDVSEDETIMVNVGSSTLHHYDLFNDVIISTRAVPSSAYDFAAVDPDGTGYIISWNSTGPGRDQGVEYFNMVGTFQRQFTQAGAHGDMGRDVAGTPCWFQVNQVRPGDPPELLGGKSVMKVRLSDGNKTLIADGIPWDLSMHMSSRANDGWVYVTVYAWTDPGLAGWHSYKNEIFRVRADGGAWERICHHRSNANLYWRTPRACISMDGNLLVFASDFTESSQGEYVDVYLIDQSTGGGGTPNMTPEETAAATLVSALAKPWSDEFTGKLAKENVLAHAPAGTVTQAALDAVATAASDADAKAQTVTDRVANTIAPNLTAAGQ